MAIEDIIDSFNKIKNIVYNKEYQKLPMSDLAELITKDNKSDEEKDILKNIFKYISVIRESISELGNKIFELYHNDEEEYENIQVYEKENLEAHTRDVILFMDKFIDSISALAKVYSFTESRDELFMMEAMLKSNRELILKKANEYRRQKSLRKDIDEEAIRKQYFIFVTDIIDLVIKEAIKLSVLKIYDKIKIYGENND